MHSAVATEHEERSREPGFCVCNCKWRVINYRESARQFCFITGPCLSLSIIEIECWAARTVDELDKWRGLEGGVGVERALKSGIIDAFSAQNFISRNLLIPSETNCFLGKSKLFEASNFIRKFLLKFLHIVGTVSAARWAFVSRSLKVSSTRKFRQIFDRLARSMMFDFAFPSRSAW